MNCKCTVHTQTNYQKKMYNYMVREQMESGKMLNKRQRRQKEGRIEKTHKELENRKRYSRY